ncbi:MAG: DUF1501 domain-containing protein [Planctomyces sp.]|nr:DUF1501 domain-containing protein [Planctomyces sp.]
MSRRDFLAVGGLGVVGLSAAERAARVRAGLGRSRTCVVFVMLTGGASSQETFDPQPQSPRDHRGPFRAVETSVPGVFLSELLPKLSQRAHQFALVRSLHHSAAPIHETGLQYLQAGALGNRRSRPASAGSRLQHLSGFPDDSSVPAYAVTPSRLALNGGGPLPYDGPSDQAEAAAPAVIDDGAILLDAVPDDAQPRRLFAEGFEAQSPEIREQYGRTPFGRRLWNARQLVEHGASWITVNLFDRLEGMPTFDAHGCGASPATLHDYAQTLCPQLDRALSGFLDDLQSTGLWRDVLVVCTGEMGRTPRVNPRGGRDHWTRCWSGLLAGGCVPGGLVIGSSDSRGAEPSDRPVHLRDLTALAWQAATGGCVAAPAQLAEANPLPELSAVCV